MAASISPCVFIVTSDLSRVAVGFGTGETFAPPKTRPSEPSNLHSTKSTTGQEIYLLFTNRATIGAPMEYSIVPGGDVAHFAAAPIEVFG
jgi:hypothetical protein